MDIDFLLNLLNRVDRQQLANAAGLPLSTINGLLEPPERLTGIQKLDIEVSAAGLSLRNLNSDDDMNRAVQILEKLNLSPEALATLIASKPSPQVAPAPVSQPAPQTEEGGTTIQEMVPRFATRKKDKLSAKSLYEYGNYHRKFVAWLELRKNKKHIPVHSITRADMADYIDDLLAQGLKPKTVAEKYIPAISGLFELAQTIGVIPEGQILVSRGHKVYTKQDKKKAGSKNSYKPFTEDELKAIFQPDLLNKAKQPADFWLPMLGLFTGGRVNELSQPDITDIQNHNGIWAFSINDEGDKQLKAPASIRLIPIHPVLIQCGFIDYVNAAKKYGTKLFPYLVPDPYGSYAGRTGERWGKYLDTLGITDPQKTFHSFRSTSNICLKHNGVTEENRCQFVGHEHDTVNSAIYSEPHRLPFLLEHVASKLDYPFIDFTQLQCKAGHFDKALAKECAATASRLRHAQAKTERLARQQKQ